jgi:hypothetical protein
MDRQAADQWGDQRADAARTGRAILRELNPPMLKWTFSGFTKPRDTIRAGGRAYANACRANSESRK